MCFTSAKYPAEWSFGASQPIRNLEMGAPVLRSGTRVPKSCLAAAKIFAERSLWLRTGFAAKCQFRRGCEISQTPDFPLFLHFSCSKRLSFISFAIPPDFDHPKTYITSKQIRIKALKSKLKQVEKTKQKDID